MCTPFAGALAGRRLAVAGAVAGRLAGALAGRLAGALAGRRPADTRLIDRCVYWHSNI